jgi:hypothetical protein
MAVLHLELPDDLHRLAKMHAAAQDLTLKAFVVLALMAATGQEAYHRQSEQGAGAKLD